MNIILFSYQFLQLCRRQLGSIGRLGMHIVRPVDHPQINLQIFIISRKRGQKIPTHLHRALGRMVVPLVLAQPILEPQQTHIGAESRLAETVGVEVELVLHHHHKVLKLRILFSSPDLKSNIGEKGRTCSIWWHFFSDSPYLHR